MGGVKSVEPGQEETEIHHWESSGLKIYNINPQDINTVSFYLDVYNELDYDVIPRHGRAKIATLFMNT